VSAINHANLLYSGMHKAVQAADDGLGKHHAPRVYKIRLGDASHAASPRHRLSLLEPAVVCQQLCCLSLCLGSVVIPLLLFFQQFPSHA
jgi:hypothetical protein